MKKIKLVTPLLCLTTLGIPCLSLVSCNKPKINKFSLSLTLQDCKVNGSGSYSEQVEAGKTISNVVVTPDTNFKLTKDSVPTEYQQYWQAGEDNTWVLSGLIISAKTSFTIRATKVPEPVFSFEWDKFIDPDANDKIDTESDWKLLTDALEYGLTSDDIKRSIHTSAIVPDFDWKNEYIAKVKINNQLHTVRLVEMDVEKIDQDGNTAIMTWEFTNCICDSNKNPLRTYWDNTNKNAYDYWKSDINKMLNDEDLGSLTWYTYSSSSGTVPVSNSKSVFSMIKEGNEDLANHIKSVYRKINTYDSVNKEWALTENNEKIFLATPTNYYDPVAISNFNKLSVGEGGTQYSYYKDKVTAIKEGSMQVFYDDLKRKSVSGFDQFQIWTSSPATYMYKTQTDFKYIATLYDGGLFEVDADANIPQCVSPMFALGKTPKK